MKRTVGAEFILSSTNQKRVKARSRTRTNPNPYPASSRLRRQNLRPIFPSWTAKNAISPKKTIHYTQVKHVIEKPKTKKTEAEENLKEAEFNFMIDLRTLIHKTSVDPKLLQLKMCVRNKQKKGAPEEVSQVFSEITERFGRLFASDGIMIPEELIRQVVDELHFEQPGSTKMLAERNTFLWPGMKKEVKNKCSACTACMSSGTNLKLELASM